MNTRAIADEYRLAHWAGIMRERQESGLSIKAFCGRAGFHENIYFYWQRKLRDAASKECNKVQSETTSLTPAGFAEVKLAESHTLMPTAAAGQHQICFETAGARITAGIDYPADKLAAILREVMRP